MVLPRLDTPRAGSKPSGLAKLLGTRSDLLAVRQHKGETLRQYIQSFSQVRNTIPRISPAAIIMAFSEGVTNKQLVGKLETHNVETVSELFALAEKTPGKSRRTPGSNTGAPLRSLRRAMARSLASRQTSGNLPPSWPQKGAQSRHLGETLPAARGSLAHLARMEESGASSITPIGTTSLSVASSRTSR